MFKKIIATAISASLLFGATAFSFAETTETPVVTPATIPSTTSSTSTSADNLKLQNLNYTLQIAQNELLILNNSVETAVNTAIANALKKASTPKNDPATKLSDLEKKLSDAIEKQKKDDAAELQRLNDEKAKWLKYVETYKANLAKEINTINTNLAKTVASLVEKQKNSKTDTEKANFQAQIDLRNKYAAQKIHIITNYTASLNSFWAEKEQLWSLRQSLITKRNSLDLSFKDSLGKVRLEELKDYLQLTSSPTSTTPINEAEIRAKVTEKYKKSIDNVNKKIANYQQQIATLTAKIAASK